MDVQMKQITVMILQHGAMTRLYTVYVFSMTNAIVEHEAVVFVYLILQHVSVLPDG